MSETVKSSEKMPILLRVGLRIPGSRSEDCSFIGRQHTIVKGNFTISLSKRSMFFNWKADKK